MGFSAHKQPTSQPANHLLGGGGPIAAPPPTPSTQPSHHLGKSGATADTVSQLLSRLPPTLTLPSRRRPSPPSTLPLVTLSDPKSTDLLLSSASKLGFFQLTGHDISSQLAISAETESLSLFKLTKEQKESYFPRNWPVGYDVADEEEEEANDQKGESFCLEGTSLTESTEVSLSSLHEFTQALESAGLKIIDRLASAVGFENPVGEDPTRFSSLMWISKGFQSDQPDVLAGFYPYIVGLQYQIRSQKHSLMADSGWVSVLPQVDSVLVTFGDIAHVWSNGRLKKVRGRPVACLGGEEMNSPGISMTLLLTLPLDSTVSPLLPTAIAGKMTEEEEEVYGEKGKGEERLFGSFSFEDYAWRVYHERLHFKDPLERYRIY